MKLKRSEISLLRWMLNCTKDWRGSLIGEPIALAEFDADFYKAKELFKKLRKRKRRK